MTLVALAGCGGADAPKPVDVGGASFKACLEAHHTWIGTTTDPRVQAVVTENRGGDEPDATVGHLTSFASAAAAIEYTSGLGVEWRRYDNRVLTVFLGEMSPRMALAMDTCLQRVPDAAGPSS